MASTQHQQEHQQGHGLVAPWWGRLAEAVFSRSWVAPGCDNSKSTQLSFPLFPLTCFENNYSVTMHIDIFILKLLLSSWQNSLTHFLWFCCTHISSKCQGIIVQLFQLGKGKAQSEQWRGLNKVCSWEGRERVGWT